MCICTAVRFPAGIISCTSDFALMLLIPQKTNHTYYDDVNRASILNDEVVKNYAQGQ